MPITISAPQVASRGDFTTGSFTADLGAAEAGRIVVIGLAGVPGGGGQSAFSSGTIAGVTIADSFNGVASDDNHVWVYAEVPSGTGTQTISLTLTQTIFECVSSVWVLRGADLPRDDADYAFDDSFGFQASTTSTTTANGAILGIASFFTGQSPSFASSTGTLTVATSVETASRGQFAVNATDLAAGTFTISQDTNFCFAVSALTFPEAAAAPTPDDLLADNVQSTSTVSVPTTGQTHNLTSQNIRSLSTVSVPVAADTTNNLTAVGVQSLSTVAAGVFSQSQVLNAENIQSASTVASPALSEAGVTFRTYYYANSLFDHATGAGDDNTKVANWMDRLADSSNDVYLVDAEFGFLDQWTAPPRANLGYTEAASAGITSNTWTGANAIDRVAFVPDNFDGPTFDPDAIPNIATQSYQDGISALIQAWETNASNAPDRYYAIYTGWPDMGPYGNPATISASNLLAWQTYALGAYQDWMELLVSRLQTQNPGVDIRILDINRVLMETYQNTVVSTIAAGDLFEDDAPHGRSSWYFLAAIVDYMHLYNKKPPANFPILAGYNVNSVITNNFSTIVDYMWLRVLNTPTVDTLNAQSVQALSTVSVPVVAQEQQMTAVSVTSNLTVSIPTALVGNDLLDASNIQALATLSLPVIGQVHVIDAGNIASDSKTQNGYFTSPFDLTVRNIQSAPTVSRPRIILQLPPVQSPERTVYVTADNRISVVNGGR